MKMELDYFHPESPGLDQLTVLNNPCGKIWDAARFHDRTNHMVNPVRNAGNIWNNAHFSHPIRYFYPPAEAT